MKKLFVLLLALLLIGSFALAETVDFASMTDDELNALIAGAQAELSSRKSGDEYWYNEGGITIYPAGRTKYTAIGNIYGYGIVVENNSDKTINVSCDCVVNGWSVMASGVQGVAPGQTKKDFVSMMAKDAGVESEEDVETFDITCKIYGEDYKTIAEFGPITVNPKQ